MAEPLIGKAKKEAEQFYKKVLGIITKNEFPILVGGTYALKFHTGIDRPTKDIDFFCKAGDYPKILKTLADEGFTIEVNDDRWLAKALYGKYFVDIIFGSMAGTWPINDTWFENAPTADLFGYKVKVTPPEELIISKIYRHNRTHYDGIDVVNIMLRKGKNIDWKRLSDRLEHHWELLLAHIILYRFSYPSERDIVPKWLMDELLLRVQSQLAIPTPQDKVCRGTLLSLTQFKTAITKWGFKDVTQFH